MKTYKIEIRTSMSHEITVKAKSQREAIRKAEDIAMREECCFGDDTQCGDDGVETKIVSKR